MESLRKQLPDLALSVSSPDLHSITQFFYSKSLSEGSVEGNKDKESTSMPVDVTSKDQENAAGRPQMQVDRCVNRIYMHAEISPGFGIIKFLFFRGDFESETDTEEFEKIGQGPPDSKLNYFEGIKQTMEKQSEVRVQQSASLGSSNSTNISPINSKGTDLNRSSSSSEPGSYHFPSLTISDRLCQLSPLAECIENGASGLYHQRLSCDAQTFSNVPLSLNSDIPNSSSPNQSAVSQPVGCDGQQQQQNGQQQCGSESSSPVGAAGADFEGTEYYMDESLPSSLSEHPTDSQHQAIVSLLQVLDDLQLAELFPSRSRKRSTTTLGHFFPLPPTFLLLFEIQGYINFPDSLLFILFIYLYICMENTA